MINCAFIIFKNFNHCIKELILLSSVWFCYLNYIYALKTTWTIILTERNIGVRYFKPVQIIGWWNKKDSFTNANICIMEIINDIQNPVRKSMHIHNSNVYYEGFRMRHGTIGLIKINTLNMRTLIYTVA